MSLNRYLTIIDQEQTLATAKATSVGVADANKIIATDSTGKVNESLFPYLFEGVIAAGGSQVVYTESFTNFLSTELALSFSSTTNVKSFSMNIIKNGLSVDDTIFRRNGQIDLSIVSIVSSGDILVTVTNNEANSISYRVRKIIT